MCAVFATAVECSKHRVVDLTRIVAATRSIEYLRLNRKAAITMNLTGLGVDIPRTSRCALHLATTAEYNARRIMDMAA